MGSTHRDNYPSFLKFGYSESAEDYIVAMFDAADYYVWYDYYYFYNYEPYRAEDDHIWLNDGWASEVMVF